MRPPTTSSVVSTPRVCHVLRFSRFYWLDIEDARQREREKEERERERERERESKDNGLLQTAVTEASLALEM